MTGRSYRIRCGTALHRVDMTEDGNLVFREHPQIFADLAAERSLAALAGEPAPESDGCYRVAFLVRYGRLYTFCEAGDDARELLAAIRGTRIARQVRRKSAWR